MKELTITTGVQEYHLNDKCTVVFNPSDPAFADKLYTAFDALKKKQDARDNNVEKMSAREMFDWLRNMDAEMRKTIDGVFEHPEYRPDLAICVERTAYGLLLYEW